MSTISSQLTASAFFSSPEIGLVALSSPPIRFDWLTNPEFKPLVLHKPVKTPNPRKADSLTVPAYLVISNDSQIGDWRLKSVMVVQLRRTRKQWLATTWLEGVAEYGTAETDGEAITDLVVSLGEYRESLEKREKKLGDSARNELAYLRNLIERSGGT